MNMENNAKLNTEFLGGASSTKQPISYAILHKLKTKKYRKAENSSILDRRNKQT